MAAGGSGSESPANETRHVGKKLEFIGRNYIIGSIGVKIGQNTYRVSQKYSQIRQIYVAYREEN